MMEFLIIEGELVGISLVPVPKIQRPVIQILSVNKQISTLTSISAESIHKKLRLFVMCFLHDAFGTITLQCGDCIFGFDGTGHFKSYCN